jgi:hypothetical protein
MSEPTMKEHLRIFSNMVAKGEVEIYNEFSLQHEFGIFLRGVQQNMKVQFERSAEWFFGHDDFVKTEIDLTVFSGDKSQLDCAIEFKFPQNGQYPERMYSMCIDIAFLEQLKVAGFKRGYLIAFADDPLFWQGRKTDGIYGYFREQRALTGTIRKPTRGEGIPSVTISGQYTIDWNAVTNTLMCTLVEI